MEPKNRLQEILSDLGIQELRLDENLLAQMGMSQRRFNKLANSTARMPMTVSEANGLQKWLHDKFKGRNAYLFEADMPTELKNKQSRLNL